MLYSAVFFSNPDKIFTYSAINVQKILTIFSCTIITIILVGQLRAMVTKQAKTITMQNKKFIEILNSINVELEIIDLKSKKIYYSNNPLNENKEAFLAPLKKEVIEKFRKDKSYKHSWDYFDEETNTWYLVVDLLIDWPGNGECRLQQRFDITDAREKNIRLQEAIQTAEESNKAKSDFLSMMSHEIRTPIGVIIGVTEIAQSKYEEGEHKDDFSQINSAATHLLGIINDILDMSKIEAGKFELSKTDTDLSSIVKRVENITMFMFKDKNQKFIIDVDERIKSAFSIDVQRISQVITNLLSNASKFTENGKDIGLSVKLIEENKTSMKLLFEVKDSGIGMTKEQVDKLFRPFEQADKSISRRFGGTGLGLAISKNIIENMEGEIWVTSEVAKGSVFSFSIPVVKSKRVQEKNTKEEDISNIFSGKKILLVEDIEINRIIVKSFLEKTNIVIDEAENGQKALSILEDKIDEYDLVLMDIQMPIMDGYTATEKIRKINKEKARTIPILAMTANVFKRDIQKCLDAGMNAHIGKPIDFTSLVSTLENYLQ